MSVELIELGMVRPRMLGVSRRPGLGVLGLDLGLGVSGEAIGYGVGSLACIVGAAVFPPGIPYVSGLARVGLLGVGAYLAYKTAVLFKESKAKEEQKTEEWRRTGGTPAQGSYTPPAPARADYDLRTRIWNPTEGENIGWWPFRTIWLDVRLENWGRYPVSQYFQAFIYDSDGQLEDSSSMEFKTVDAYDEQTGNPGKEQVSLGVDHPGVHRRGFSRRLEVWAGSDEYNMRPVANTWIYLV